MHSRLFGMYLAAVPRFTMYKAWRKKHGNFVNIEKSILIRKVKWLKLGSALFPWNFEPSLINFGQRVESPQVFKVPHRHKPFRSLDSKSQQCQTHSAWLNKHHYGLNVHVWICNCIVYWLFSNVQEMCHREQVSEIILSGYLSYLCSPSWW